MPSKSSQLVIVESPAKAKTIAHFLGKEYIVKASMGHIRDLPKSKMGIDIENNFEPTYLISPEKKKVIQELKKHVSPDTTLYIATDEDREGEAIGWHLVQALKINPKKQPIKRIVFHEITEDAIKEALKNPRTIDKDLVDAQQARRVLDRLVGYELSPLLWKKIRYGLSAGRVQSVAVRLIVEREREIRAFIPVEYWSITAQLLADKEMFEAQLSKFQGKEIKINNQKEADKILKDLENAIYTVTAIEEKEVKRRPAPPFTTSTLQQEASRKLGFSVKKTMMIAQQLYEGVHYGKGTAGLITYMRTDSANLSEVALKQMQQFINKEFGKEYGLKTPRKYSSRKGAQEAHEAIRPVNINIKPEDVKSYLEKDQYRLYELIWKRALACQMAEAKLNAVGVDITPSVKGKDLEYKFRATGQTITFPGFLRIYVEDYDNPEEALSHQEKLLPPLKKGQTLDLKELLPAQHFTKPPARYTEASLVKKLESEGIGRPSTYAPTITTIMTRGYIEKENKQLKPTDLAEVVTDVLVEHFPDIVDYKFTAEMEESLDLIAEGKKEWVPLMRSFYNPFHKVITEKENTLKRSDIVNLETTDEICEKCGAPMIIKLGRYGKFLSCSNYPTCKNAKPLKEEGSTENPDGNNGGNGENNNQPAETKVCTECGKQMEIKRSRFGTFWGCSGYPDCKHIEKMEKSTGITCPECKEGELVQRRTRKGGRIFWGCNKYPKCSYATWTKPGEEGKKSETSKSSTKAKSKSKKSGKKKK